MIDITILGGVTCYAIIIAMAVIIFKAFSYPLSNFFNAINPFSYIRRINQLSERVNELEMEKYNTNQEIQNIKKQLKSRGK
jgi:sensor histidine kinase YesM